MKKMAGKFERKPWLDGILVNEDQSAAGNLTLYTAILDFYLVSVLIRVSAGPGAYPLRDGGALGAIIVNTTIFTGANVPYFKYFGDSPPMFATDVFTPTAAVVLTSTLTGYDA